MNITDWSGVCKGVQYIEQQDEIQAKARCGVRTSPASPGVCCYRCSFLLFAPRAALQSPVRTRARPG